jgi:hypothetical protein
VPLPLKASKYYWENHWVEDASVEVFQLTADELRIGNQVSVELALGQITSIPNRISCETSRKEGHREGHISLPRSRSSAIVD